MDTGQALAIEDDSSGNSSEETRFPRPRKGTPIPVRKDLARSIEPQSLRPDFSFTEDQTSLKDVGVEDDDSLSIVIKPEFVKKQPRRLYSKETASIEARAHSTASESMRKSSLKKPSTDRPSSLATPRIHSVIARTFLFPKRQKLLRPLPLVGYKTPKTSPNCSTRQSIRSVRLKKYRKILEEALRLKAIGHKDYPPSTPKTRDSHDSSKPTPDFKTSFPVGERKIPSYDAKKDRHVKVYSRRGMKSQTQQRREVVEVPKRNTVRFEDEVTQIEPQTSDSRKNLLLPKVLPRPSDRPSSAPHSQIPLPSIRRDQYSVPRSRFEQLPLERDWAKSVLETISLSDHYSFNSLQDSRYMTEDQISETLAEVGWKSYSISELKARIALAQSTLSKLHEDLMLPTQVLQSVPVSKEGLQALLFQCRSNLQIRDLILSLLAAIHLREDRLLALMALGEDAGSDFPRMYNEVMSLSKSILSKIAQFRTLTQDEKFYYMEAEYAEKIHEDSSNLMTAFRHLLGEQRDYLNATITPEDLRGRKAKEVTV